MIQSKDKYPQNIVNPNFQKLLNKFHSLIEGNPKAEKIKDKLIALKNEAFTTFLTGHQKDAIVARCNNYLNGTYGSTSRKHLLNGQQLK